MRSRQLESPNFPSSYLKKYDGIVLYGRYMWVIAVQERGSVNVQLRTGAWINQHQQVLLLHVDYLVFNF